MERLAAAPDGITARAVSAGDLARSPDEGLADRDLFDGDLLALEDVQHLTDRTADAACELIDARVVRRRATVLTASAGPAVFVVGEVVRYREKLLTLSASCEGVSV